VRRSDVPLPPHAPIRTCRSRVARWGIREEGRRQATRHGIVAASDPYTQGVSQTPRSRAAAARWCHTLNEPPPSLVEALRPPLRTLCDGDGRLWTIVDTWGRHRAPRTDSAERGNQLRRSHLGRCRCAPGASLANFLNRGSQVRILPGMPAPVTGVRAPHATRR
jgi:hypothetical protein